ncbi:MAG: hypothetical protein E7616_07405 [Ruminococcaceae bacterium]|nr:hypothetical protein [Oscillospiraceae bacterium]
MKVKLLSLLLALLMLVSCFTGCGSKKNPPTDPNEQPTAIDPTEGDDWVDTETPGGATGGKTHKKADFIPSSLSLIGTDFLPPIGNQGSIGSCASSSIAYCQFTNAVARYLHSIDPNSQFKPATGKSEYLISSKFTMNFSGAGTAWVYDVLKDHGALVRADSDFYRNSAGGSTAGPLDDPYLQSSDWDVADGELTKALNMRAVNYEQIWMNGYNNQLTTTDKGKELVEKIKDAVVTGNVVVTGGFSSYWKYGVIDNDGLGDLGKAGDEAIVYSAESGSPGGHQVSIVGYDDNITATVAGVTMKGAFQVANSWGIWKNDGYVWLMYDAVNKVSEYEGLQNKDIYSTKRYLSIGNDSTYVGQFSTLGENSTDIIFVKKGTATIEGKTYPTFYIHAKGNYLTYEKNKIGVHTAVNDEIGLWAVIPIQNAAGMSDYSAQKYSEDMNGGYLLYAVNAVGNHLLYGGTPGGNYNTTPSLTSLTGTYTYSNICFALPGFSDSKDQQMITVLCHNGNGDETPRTFSMDQFCFLYWDCDIVCNDPGYTVTVELEAKDREGFYLELTRTDASNKTTTYTPAIFRYGENFSNVHPDNEYISSENYLNFNGEVNGNACTGYFTLSYATMISPGDNYENYIWGVNITQTHSTIRVKKITLKDGNGNILSQIIPEDSQKATGKYVFDFGKEIENERNIGTFHLQNASGEFLVSHRVALLVPGEQKNAAGIEFIYDHITNEYTLKLEDKIYILDIKGKNIQPGINVQFNNHSAKRNTQTWRVIQNEDGTVNIRLACNTKYAIGIKDGNTCLVAGKDIKTYGTWTLIPGGTNDNVFEIAKTDAGLTVICTKPEIAGNITVNIADENGTLIKTETPVFNDKGTASFTLDSLNPGTYVISLLVNGKVSEDYNRCVYILK